MITPLVSIIMPCYNAEKYLNKAIDSVLEQTYQNWELLIVDDMSQDRSKDIASSYAQKDARIQFFCLPQKGFSYGARNFAIDKAKGEYIAFLDSDDLWLKEKLEKQIKYMQEQDCPLTFSDYYLMDKESKIFSKPYQNPKYATYHSLLLKCSSIHFSSVIYSVQALGKRYFKETDVEDFVFLLDILKTIPQAENIVEPLTIYRIANPEARSGNKIRIALKTWKVYRKVEKLNFFYVCYAFLSYSIRGVLKYYPYRKS